MTLEVTAGAPPILFPDDSSEYRAGACNIGQAEITRRRRFGHAALIFTIVLFAVLVAIGAPPLVRAIVGLPAAVVAACYLEAALKFCIGFGWLGVFNFGAYGTTSQVADGTSRAIDRRRSFRLSVACAVIALSAAVVAVLLPV